MTRALPVFVFLLAAFSLVAFAPPEPVPTVATTWTADQSHSQIDFKVRHLGISNVRGSFDEYDVVMRFDPADLTTLQVETTIDASSINTENERRDNHLRSDDFFNAEQYPTLTFVSKEVRNIDGESFEVVGDLTIRDVTKEVVLDAAFLGTTTQRDRRKAGFTAETTINRFDYGLKWDRLTEAGGLVVGEDVQIILELEMVEAEPEGAG